jgi:hypothetical protein
MDRQFFASGNKEFQGFTDFRFLSIQDLVNPNRSSHRCCDDNSDGQGPLLTGSLQSLGFPGLVQGFARVAGALDGFFAEREAGVHGGSQVAPQGATLISRPAGSKTNTFP